MKRWEYCVRVVPRQGKVSTEDLNAIGSEGWELCGVGIDGDVLGLILKRELPEVDHLPEAKPQMTIAEAFREAGYPLPDDGAADRPIWYDVCGERWACGSVPPDLPGYYLFCDLDKNAQGWGMEPTGEGWGWVYQPLSDPSDNEFDVRFNLANLPASDAYATLPPEVQQALGERK